MSTKNYTKLLCDTQFSNAVGVKPTKKGHMFSIDVWFVVDLHKIGHWFKIHTSDHINSEMVFWEHLIRLKIVSPKCTHMQRVVLRWRFEWMLRIHLSIYMYEIVFAISQSNVKIILKPKCDFVLGKWKKMRRLYRVFRRLSPWIMNWPSNWVAFSSNTHTRAFFLSLISVNIDYLLAINDNYSYVKRKQPPAKRTPRTRLTSSLFLSSRDGEEGKKWQGEREWANRNTIVFLIIYTRM